MAGYKGGWIADPFIIDVDKDSITLLVEEFRFDTGRGRLSKVSVSRPGYKLLNIVPILELPTHLSFPLPIRHDNKTYIMPENCAANEVSLYQFDGNRLHDKIKILDGRFVDTQIVEHDGTFYAFTTRPGANGGASTLEIYSADSLYGPWTHTQTINSKSNTQRGAGPIFVHNGRIVRPTQDCSVSYGKGLVFNELKHSRGWRETLLCAVNANDKYDNGLCLHTFSPHGNFAAIDGFDYPIRAIGNLAPKIYNLKLLITKFLGR